jgi:hypothetical protein
LRDWYQVWFTSKTSLLFVLFKAIWFFNDKADLNSPPLSFLEILGVQLIGIFLLLTNTIEDVVYFIKMMTFVHYMTKHVIKVSFFYAIYGMQLAISLTATYICFIGVVKGNDPLNIFKDLLAFASITQIDNMMFSLQKGQDIGLQIKNSDIIQSKLEVIEIKTRIFYSIFVLSLTNFNIFYSLFYSRNIYPLWWYRIALILANDTVSSKIT